MSRLDRWLKRLPLDSQTERALSETLRDAHEEIRQSSSWMAGLVASTQAAIAVLRVAAGASVRSAASADGVRAFGAVLLIDAVLTVAIVALFSLTGGNFTVGATRFGAGLFLVPYAVYGAALSEWPSRPQLLPLIVAGLSIMVAGVCLLGGSVDASQMTAWGIVAALMVLLVLIADRALMSEQPALTALIGATAPATLTVVFVRVQLLAMRGVPGSQTTHFGWVMLAAHAATWILLVRRQEQLREVVQ